MSLHDYLRAVRSVRRKPESPQRGALALDPTTVARWRIQRQHLDGRLSPAELGRAARAGLQDTSPRAALLSLHARVDDVKQDSWEDQRLVQIWFRSADYVVPRTDVGVFTLGTLPRDQKHRAALDGLADEVVRLMAGAACDPREVGTALGDPLVLRHASATGRVHIRWDARTITMRPAEPADLDEEQARAELARRFLSWLGPSDVRAFARWAGVTLVDAGATWSALTPELVPVALEGEGRWILARDEKGMRQAGPSSTTRLLPQLDPLLRPQGGLGRLPAPLASALVAQGVSPQLVNALTGRVLSGDRIVGAWARRGGSFTVLPYGRWATPLTDAVTEEAQRIAQLLDSPLALAWLSAA